jgi:ABC-type transporter Mla subunit MlaD
VQQTLTAGAGAATAIDGAIQSLDKFVRYVSPAETNAVPETNSTPFNVLDYGTAAGQIGTAARDLNTLLATVNQHTPELARQLDELSAQATADANAVVDHAFKRGLVLVLVLVAGLALAGKFWRSPARLKPSKTDKNDSPL